MKTTGWIRGKEKIMDDCEIVGLYWQRSEDAIPETERKYGAFCLSLARNLSDTREDAEECVNDTYYEAWTSMPEERPGNLGAWLGRVVRNIAVDRFRKNRARKRDGRMDLLLDELDECVPDPSADPERASESAQIAAALDRWLRTLDAEDRRLFLRRYWYDDALKRLAEASGEDAARLAQRMFRLRKSLRRALEKEGIGL